MTEMESKNLEYLSEVFKGLSAERKEHLLDVARSLLEVQDNKDCLVDNEDVSHSKGEVTKK